MAILGFLPGLANRRQERAGFTLYTQVAALARTQALFLDYGIPDTLDGRFDALALFSFLLMDRLRFCPPPGPALAQAVFDAMFSDLDVTLREMGAGDPTVPRKMKAMWDALHGRALAYRTALTSDELPALADALARNAWRGAPPTSQAPMTLARLVQAQAAHLAQQEDAALIAGQVSFLPIGLVAP